MTGHRGLPLSVIRGTYSAMFVGELSETNKYGTCDSDDDLIIEVVYYTCVFTRIHHVSR